MAPSSTMMRSWSVRRSSSATERVIVSSSSVGCDRRRGWVVSSVNCDRPSRRTTPALKKVPYETPNRVFFQSISKNIDIEVIPLSVAISRMLGGSVSHSRPPSGRSVDVIRLSALSSVVRLEFSDCRPHLYNQVKHSGILLADKVR